MSLNVDYLDLAANGFAEVGDMAKDISEVIKKGDEQADTRKGVILTVHQMCDTLQMAVDLISMELSKSIIEFSNLRNGDPEALPGFFERTTFNFSNAALRKLLHDGKVCGELHALKDRFTQPFSDTTTGGVSFWQNVITLFRRSNAMSDAIEGLYLGEIDFINDAVQFLNDLTSEAESATSISCSDTNALIEAGDLCTNMMREKRGHLQNQIKNLRLVANECIGKLH